MPYQNLNLIPLYVAIGVSVMLVGVSLWKKILTVPATAVAVVVLIAVSLFTGYAGLVAFSVSFLGAGIIGLIKKDLRREREIGLYPHVGARGVVQVLVNSLPALIFGLIYFLSGCVAFLYASCVAVTAGFSDSAASDIGILSEGKVISIVTFKQAPRGISGGVSLLGTVAGVVASLIVAVCAFLTPEIEVDGIWIIAVGGVIGMLVDSILGATLQRGYKCMVCGAFTERLNHCDAPTEQVKGLKFIDNNAVNFLSQLIAGAISLLFFI